MAELTTGMKPRYVSATSSFRESFKLLRSIQTVARHLCRVARSDSKAETLSAANDMFCGPFVTEPIAHISALSTVELTIGSTSSQSLCTLLEELEEQYKKVYIVSICEAIGDSGFIDDHCCPGKLLLNYRFTQESLVPAVSLLDILWCDRMFSLRIRKNL